MPTLLRVAALSAVWVMGGMPGPQPIRVSLPMPVTLHVQEVIASWYSLPGSPTASGALMDPDAMTCAHRELPFGAEVVMECPETGKTIVVTVNDRGPYIPGREFDLSRGAAEALGIIEQGVARLKVRVLGAKGSKANRGRVG